MRKGNQMLSVLLHPGQRLIRVKSYRPYLGRYGLEWPTMLIETRGGGRETVTPVWNSAKVQALLRGLVRALAGRGVACALLAVLALSSCTHVVVDLEKGTATVDTFAVSRQATDIGRDADGSVHWRSQNADATSVLSLAVLNLSKVLTPAAAAVVP